MLLNLTSGEIQEYPCKTPFSPSFGPFPNTAGSDLCNCQVNLSGRREVIGRFDGGRITSDGGGLLRREVDQRLGLLDRLAVLPNAPLPFKGRGRGRGRGL